MPFVLHSGDLQRSGETISNIGVPVLEKPCDVAVIREALGRALLSGQAESTICFSCNQKLQAEGVCNVLELKRRVPRITDPGRSRASQFARSSTTCSCAPPCQLTPKGNL
ncbi:response regulator [Limimaricola litoreus]|uniref:Response regulatory domain-containing protein n=1 Tax=Limimaricola litoreus TaxID=2955316 RepID=A0A9X2FTZ2_9RHOB|nr:hypothetical protein [Limimaricola litoreus]MCP1168411.1 hypothetical protein [Limimaricola litoreus]